MKDNDFSGHARAVSLNADRAMRVYIAGPMTGLPEFNFPAFNAMAAVLRADGWHVENPAEHGHVDGAEWADYLRYDISRLSTCSAMMLLPGWSSSRGARLEVSIAKELGHELLFAVGAEPLTDPQPQGEPVAIVVEQTHNYGSYLVFGSSIPGVQQPVPVIERKAHLLDQSLPTGTKLYAEQPAPVAVLSGGQRAGKAHLAGLLESLAKQVYQSWESQPGFAPWVDGGNSLKQDEARQIASRTFELALANRVGD